MDVGRRLHATFGVLALICVAACGSSGPSDDEQTTRVDVPSGVTLTDTGQTLATDESATVMWHAGERVVSVITMGLDDVEEGDIDDFEFFSLSDEEEDSTPFYVRLDVSNEGPAGLGGRVPPVQLVTQDDEIWSPNPINGELDACDDNQLPDSFLPDENAEVCLVYLIDDDAEPERVRVTGAADQDPIDWQMPD